jgi:hypothetical protein
MALLLQIWNIANQTSGYTASDIVVDSNENAYVGIRTAIYKYSPDGVVLNTFTSSDLTNAFDMAIDHLSGTIYVTLLTAFIVVMSTGGVFCAPLKSVSPALSSAVSLALYGSTLYVSQ